MVFNEKVGILFSVVKILVYENNILIMKTLPSTEQLNVYRTNYFPRHELIFLTNLVHCACGTLCCQFFVQSVLLYIFSFCLFYAAFENK